MDKSSFLLCTDNNGQPILDEHGKYIYYCIKTGTLTILNQLLGEASIGNKETAVNESISETAMNETAMSENTNENTANILQIKQIRKIHKNWKWQMKINLLMK
ncbi:uncharacterized protein LOC126851601 isoform X3 [Cataglyphis hispanica]|uniref:uncharacterized protein LOC126851601 isoform X3 n=1 Tax=Cataglyphis hispanica TaxID=1086592 RepID=UPI0021806F4B|nr:uncharacterized protein LOC126851601 isoform X3 [Cataglyphis hispanica]